LNGVTDVVGNTGPASTVMGLLIGDVNASKRTDNGDAIPIRNQSGSIPNSTTFRSDLNCSGRIDNGDAIIVRDNSGTVLPPPWASRTRAGSGDCGGRLGARLIGL
jgi:hypothetical protein